MKYTTLNATSLRIQQLLAKRKQTRYWLAIEADMPHSTLDAIINGKNKSVTLAVIQKICVAFNITLAEFFSSELFDNDNFSSDIL